MKHTSDLSRAAVSLMTLMMAIFTLASGSEALAVTFKEALAAHGGGFQTESAESQSAALEEARIYAHYRQYPESRAGQDFVLSCRHGQGTRNRFCMVIDYKAASEPADPIPLKTRQQFFKAIASLDNEAERAKRCPSAVKQLKSVLTQTKSTRLTPRALYWQWVCSQLGKKPDPKQTLALKEELWQKFPFSLQSLLVMEASADARLQEVTTAETDYPVQYRSEENPAMNDIIVGLEALVELEEEGAAAVVERRFGDDIQALELPVQLYIVALMNKASRDVPSVLPITRLLLPLVIKYPELRSATTLRLLFPDDYNMRLIRDARDVAFDDLLEELRGPIDWSLLAALIHQESAFNPRAASAAKAYGLTQMLIPTAQDAANTWSEKPLFPISRDMLFDPKISIQLGVIDFQRRLRTFDYDLPMALASYNAGETGVAEWMERAAPKIKDPRVRADLLFLTEKRDSRISEYPAGILAKQILYRELYGRP